MSRPALNEIEWIVRVLAGHYNNGNDDEPARLLTFYHARRSQGLIVCMHTARMDYEAFLLTGILPPYIAPDYDRIRRRMPLYSHVVVDQRESEIPYLRAAE